MSKRAVCTWSIRALAPAAFLALGIGAGRAQSDSAQTPPDQPGESGSAPTWSAPFLPSTNAVSSSFLDSHPELEQSPPDPALALHANANAEAPPAIQTQVDRFAFPEGSPDELVDHLLVVYNSLDPASKSLADYYVFRRQIPAERVLGIACSDAEEITRQQYNDTVREPIISYIFAKNWMQRRSVLVDWAGQTRNLLAATHNDIWAIVLMRGVPLRIANDPNLEGEMEDLPALRTNAAAVDSELATLPVFGLPAGGFVPNVYFDRSGSGLVRAGPELATKLILVTRLDGPRPADVRRMIDDTLYAEENRLAGLAVIDSRGLADGRSNYAIGDDWLRSSRDMLLREGWTVKFDNKPEVLPPSDPLNHVALYLGWYHAGACGPWITPPNRFARGAIAYHLHSFSATTVRSANAAWVGPLIADGAAATMGCVYEPYLDLTPHLDVFTRRLLQGNSFAEAAYASQRGLSWMVTVVGDPLYRPFKKSIDSVVAASTATGSDHYDWLLLQQTKRAIVRNEIPQTVPSLQHYLDVPGAVAQEGLGDLLAKLGDSEGQDAALHAYHEAATLDTQPVDRIRVGLKLIQEYGREAKTAEQQTELRALRALYPTEAPAFGVPAPVEVAGNNSPQLTYRPMSGLTLAPPKPPRPPKPTPIPSSPISDNP